MGKHDATSERPSVADSARVIINRFVANGPARSVAAKTMVGPELRVFVEEGVTRPAASLVKIPIACSVLIEGEEGRLDLARRVPPGDLAATVYPSILAAFDPDSSLSIRELIALSLVTSDNPAASYLLNLVGMEKANVAARVLGARNTEVMVGFGDHQLGGDVGRRNRTTAEDALAMVETIVETPRWSLIRRYLENNLRNSRLPAQLPDELKIPHKTGSLAGVVNDAGVITGRHSQLGIAVLCDGEPDGAATSFEIGHMVRELMAALGEDV